MWLSSAITLFAILMMQPMPTASAGTPINQPIFDQIAKYGFDLFPGSRAAAVAGATAASGRLAGEKLSAQLGGTEIDAIRKALPDLNYKPYAYGAAVLLAVWLLVRGLEAFSKLKR